LLLLLLLLLLFVARNEEEWMGGCGRGVGGAVFYMLCSERNCHQLQLQGFVQLLGALPFLTSPQPTKQT
jgi:hypothetical protein